MNVTDTRESTAARVNLLDFDHAALTEWCASIGEKPFRATQLSRWLHRHVECDFDKMTNLAKVFRAKLKDLAEVRSPLPIAEKKSADGTRKWLFDVGNGNAVESVFIPEDDRGTLCISTQAGCAMGCLFCSTGKQGFNRNLSTAEIVGQLWYAERELRQDRGVTDPNDRIISNVVLMGMGEPLQNLDNVIPALRLFLDDNGYGLSPTRDGFDVGARASDRQTRRGCARGARRESARRKRRTARPTHAGQPQASPQGPDGRVPTLS